MARPKIEPITGWILVTRDRETPPFGKDKWSSWRVCWEGTFSTKAKAMAFAKNNHWPKPYRAVRGRIAAA